MIKARKSIKGGLIGVIPDNSILSMREVAGKNVDKSIPENVRNAVKIMVGGFNMGGTNEEGEVEPVSTAIPEGVGSFFQNAQPYSSDVDVNTKINLNSVLLPNGPGQFAAERIQGIVARVVKLTSWNRDKPSGQLLFSDFKCGKDAAGRGIHWTWQEILNNSKQVDGAELTLVEVMQDENDPFPIMKLDIITLVLGKYTEISMVYMISVDGKAWNYKPLGNDNYIEILRSDTMDKIREGKYLKACKRIFSNARIKVRGVIDLQVCNAVLPLLTSNAAKLAACGSSLDTIRLMADQNTKVNQMFINKEFVIMADSISSIQDLDLDQNYINQKLRYINTKIGQYKGRETGVAIEELSEYITDKTSAATVEYLRSLGINKWTDLPVRYIDRSELDDDDLPDVPDTGVSDVIEADQLLLMPPPAAKPKAAAPKIKPPERGYTHEEVTRRMELMSGYFQPPKWFIDSPGIEFEDFGERVNRYGESMGGYEYRRILYNGVDITDEALPLRPDGSFNKFVTPAGLEAIKRKVRGEAAPKIKIKPKSKAALAPQTFDAALPKWFTDSPGIKVKDNEKVGMRSVIYLDVDITDEPGIDTPAGLEAVKRMIREIRGVAEPAAKIKIKNKSKAKAIVELADEPYQGEPEDFFADPNRPVEKADPMKDALTVRKSDKGVDYYMEPVVGMPRMPAMQQQRQQLPIRIEMPKPKAVIKARARAAPLAIGAPAAPAGVKNYLPSLAIRNSDGTYEWPTYLEKSSYTASGYTRPQKYRLFIPSKTNKSGLKNIAPDNITDDMDVYIMYVPPGSDYHLGSSGNYGPGSRGVRTLIRKGSVSAPAAPAPAAPEPAVDLRNFIHQQLYILDRDRKDGALRAKKIRLTDITPDMDVYIMVKPPGKTQSVRQLIRKGSVSGKGMYETTSNDLGRYATPTYNQIEGGSGLQGSETTGNLVGSYLAPTYKQDVENYGPLDEAVIRGGAENYSPAASRDQGGRKGYTTGVYSRYIPEAPIYPKIFGKTKVMAVPVPKRPLTAFGQARVVEPSMWNNFKF